MVFKQVNFCSPSPKQKKRDNVKSNSVTSLQHFELDLRSTKCTVQGSENPSTKSSKFVIQIVCVFFLYFRKQIKNIYEKLFQLKAPAFFTYQVNIFPEKFTAVVIKRRFYY